jgi:hypothetical protein
MLSIIPFLNIQTLNTGSTKPKRIYNPNTITMQLSEAVKKKIVSAMIRRRSTFGGSDANYARSLNIHKSAYSQLKAGKIERILKDANWISLARRLDVQIGNKPSWNTAQTPVFLYITEQLRHCQKESASGIFCDKSDIGKTYAAKEYAKLNSNVAYIDCSLHKSKIKLVKAIAKEFGVDHDGRYADIFEDLVYYLKTLEIPPLIIMDEAGDTDYPAFLEIKALWNATEGYCAWYMLGADGLEKKIRKGIGSKKVGFTEIFRRYGSKFQSIVPPGEQERNDFLQTVATQIIKENLPSKDATPSNVSQILRKSSNSLTRVQIEIRKLKSAA